MYIYIYICVLLFRFTWGFDYTFTNYDFRKTLDVLEKPLPEG